MELLTLGKKQRCYPWNTAMVEIIGAKKDDITGELRKLHIPELLALYSSSNINRNHVLVGNNPEMCTEF